MKESRRLFLLVLVSGSQDVGSMRIRDVGHSALEPTAVIDALVRNARTVPGAHALRTASLAPSAVAATQQYALVAEAMAMQPDELPPLCHCLDLEPALLALRDAQSLDIHTLAEVSNAVEALNLLAKWSEGEFARVRWPRPRPLSVWQPSSAARHGPFWRCPAAVWASRRKPSRSFAAGALP